MPVKASFVADFSEFSSEVAKAEKDLKGFEQTTEQAGAAVTRIGDTTQKATPKIGTLQTSFKQFDALLNSMGIHIGPAVQGLDELGAASGKTVTQLGYLATAGLAVGAAMAGWKIGRVVADLTNADETIAQSVARWMGWGDVAKETSGAVADALAAASKRAGREITTMDEALKVNTDWQKEHKKQAKENREEYDKWAKAAAELNIVFQDHRAVLATVNGTVVEAAKYALELGASQKVVQDAYGLTAGQIAAINQALKEQQAELKRIEELNEQVAEAIKQHWGGVGDVVDQIFGMDLLAKATTWVDAIDAIGGSVQNLRVKELEELNETMLAGIDALARSGQLTSQQSSRFAELAVAAQTALAALKPVVTTTEDLVKAQWDYVTALDKSNAAQATATQEIQKTTAAKQVAMGGKLPAHSGMEVERFGGRYVIDKTTGQVLAQLERKYGAAGFLGWGFRTNEESARVNNITINGSVLSNKDEIARVVGEALMGSYRSGGNRVPV